MLSFNNSFIVCVSITYICLTFQKITGLFRCNQILIVYHTNNKSSQNKLHKTRNHINVIFIKHNFHAQAHKYKQICTKSSSFLLLVTIIIPYYYYCSLIIMLKIIYKISNISNSNSSNLSRILFLKILSCITKAKIL